MKRGLLIILLGITFLIIVTGLGTFITNYMPTMNTPQTQTTQVGPYTVTLRVNPNPPSTSQPANCTIRILQNTTPIKGAQVTLEGAQTDMGLDTSVVQARAQGAGTYSAQVFFSTSGSWQMQVTLTLPGKPALHVAFTVTVQ
ncbi:MAG TPA: FixH family protein [Ktedonobacteraceae bacterium]|nr:FixH family protein [Ktedonobacteraceae bacterium]